MVKFNKEDKVINILKQNYDSLFRAEKKIADYIINNHNKSATMSVKELAQASSVSDATVVRMCQHCGFDGFYQMKILLLRDISEEVNNSDVIADKPIDFFINRKKDLLDSINNERNIFNIKKSIKYILNSNTIVIAAAGNTLPLAYDLEFRLNRLGLKAFSSNSNDRLLNYVSNLSSRDLLINISKSGLSKNIIQISEIAIKNNVNQICITSELNSDISEKADITIFSGKLYNDVNDSYNGLASHLGEHFINDLLVTYLLSEKYKGNNYSLSQEYEYEFFSKLKI